MVAYKRPGHANARMVSALGDRAVSNWFNRLTEGVAVADKLITSTQVLALNTTAIEVVPAPGAGKYNEFLGAIVFLDYNANAYVDDAGEDLVFTLTDKNGAEVSHTLDGSLFDGTADAIVTAYPLNAAASVLEQAANAPICLFLKSGNWTGGDSPLKVRVFYRVIEKISLERITA